MDVARKCKLSRCKFWTNTNELSQVRWYFTPDDAPVINWWTKYRLPDYDDSFDEIPLRDGKVGFRKRKIRFDRGETPLLVIKNSYPCGPWATGATLGVDPPLTYNVWGASNCCARPGSWFEFTPRPRADIVFAGVTVPQFVQQPDVTGAFVVLSDLTEPETITPIVYEPNVDAEFVFEDLSEPELIIPVTYTPEVDGAEFVFYDLTEPELIIPITYTPNVDGFFVFGGDATDESIASGVFILVGNVSHDELDPGFFVFSSAVSDESLSGDWVFDGGTENLEFIPA